MIFWSYSAFPNENRQMSANCIFCKIIKGSIPSHKLFETELSYCFLDINPLNRGHFLVIPKEHAQYMHQLSDASVFYYKLKFILTKIACGFAACCEKGDTSSWPKRIQYPSKQWKNCASRSKPCPLSHYSKG